MIKVKKNLINERFGNLVVMYQVDDYVTPQGKHFAMWHCKCDCGNECNVSICHLRSQNTQSCGCLAIEAHKQSGKLRKQNNVYNTDGEYAIGYTSKGEEFWVDKEDVPILQMFCWHYTKAGYLRARNLKDDPLKIGLRNIRLHILVMGGYDENINPNKLKVDHIIHPPRNGCKIDNRKSNLRFVTDIQNGHNKSLAINNTTGFTGVYFHKRDNIWCASIIVEKKRIYLGSFVNKYDAIKARKEAEIKYFGEYRYEVNN